MATKSKKTAKPKHIVTVEQYSNETPDAASARVLSQPEVLAAATIQQWQGNIMDVDELAKQLKQQSENMLSGNMARAETMLLS
ncbi:MAG: hypothetical protein ACXW0O_04810, partial [Methylosarcina sp.]